MARKKREKFFLQGPIYPGGQKAMLLFIQKNLIYPPEAVKAQTAGTVRIRFTIDHQGKVINSKIIAGLGHGCDEEAMRLVELLQFEIPKTHKLRVQFFRTLNIHFKLQIPIEAPTPPLPASLQFQYSISTNTGPEVAVENKSTPSTNYHYTLTIK